MSAQILIVEDNAINRKLATALLEAAGFAVRAAIDAEGALALLGQAPADLVLIDLQLPGMDGLSFAKLLRQSTRTPQPRLVAVSAFAMPSEIQRALEAGCDGYITKPIDAEKFPDQIAAFLSTAAEELP